MADTLITSVDIQAKYRKLYQFLMDYLWEYPTIEALANLEIACYKTFPDKGEMQEALKMLKQKIKTTYNELSEDDHPEFEDAFNALEKSIEDYDQNNALADLYSVVISEDTEEVVETDTEVFHMGDIQLRHLDENDEVEENDEVIEEEPDRLSNPFEEE